MNVSKFVAVALLATIGFSTSVGAELIYGMTAASSGSLSPGLNLVSFDSSTPGTINDVGPLSGVLPNHDLRSIDFRPATGQLYAISTNGSAAQLYTVDLATAALTPVGSGFTLGLGTTSRVEMDFDPVADTIRIVTGSTGTSGLANNFRLNPDDGMLVATDTNLAFDPSDAQAGQGEFSIVGAAYSNNFAGATSAVLYAWDYNTDSLVTIGGPSGSPAPDTGIMFTVNSPANFLTFNAGLGMDISGATGTLYVTHDDPATGTSMGLYTRDLVTGIETFIGAYPAGVFIVDLSVMPVAAPSPTPTPTPTPVPSGTQKPVVNVTVSPAVVHPGEDAVFIISAGDPTQFQRPVTVFYTMKGKAKLGTHYTLSGTPLQVTIGVGQTSGTVSLHAIAAVPNKTLKAKMTLTAKPAYRVGFSKKASTQIRP